MWCTHRHNHILTQISSRQSLTSQLRWHNKQPDAAQQVTRQRAVMNTSISVLSRSVCPRNILDSFIKQYIVDKLCKKNAITAQQFSKTDVCVVSQHISLAATVTTSQSPEFISTIKGVNFTVVNNVSTVWCCSIQIYYQFTTEAIPWHDIGEVPWDRCLTQHPHMSNSGKEKCAFKFKNKQLNTIWIFVEPLRQIHEANYAGGSGTF